MRALEVLGPSTGGIRQHVATLVPGLQARGWDVTVAGPAGVMDGLGVAQADVPVHLGPSAPRAVAALRRLARGVDVVHAHGLNAGWLAWAAAGRSRLVVTVHNLVLDEAAGCRARPLRVLEGALPARAAATIAISADMAARFAGSRAADRISVIPPAGPIPAVSVGRDAIRAELEVPEGVPLVVLVGRLHPQKDIGVLLEAVAAMDRPLRVAVVGEGPERPALEAQVGALGLGEVVRLVGARPNGVDYLAAADVAVMCSRWEGFGLVVAEALRLGRPLVATDVGPVSSMVVDGETGRLVPPRSPVAVRAALEDLLDDPAGAAALGAAGAMLVAERFDPEALVDRVEAVYQSVVEHR